MPSYKLSGAYADSRAHEKIVAAINEGLPVMFEFPKHYPLIIGWIQEAGKELAYVENNPGEARLQHLVPWKKAPAGYRFGRYYILKPTNPIKPAWLKLEPISI